MLADPVTLQPHQMGGERSTRMDPTGAAARMIGPLLVAGGIFNITQSRRALTLLTSVAGDEASLLMAGFLSLSLGVAVIALHSRFDSFSAILISLLGWLLAARGIFVIFFPDMVHVAIAAVLENNAILPILGLTLALTGLWLTFVGFVLHAGIRRADPHVTLSPVDPRS